LVDRDEPRFAEASREMIERGDYVVPYFNNRYRFDKPPLTYWFQVVSFRAFGENPFAARFPSAVAAALTAVAIFAWGRTARSQSRRVLGGDHLHALPANFRPWQSRGR
jgi:4-amino-4-deoxy-L-arabinose transferase-like glycosyltransferase